MTDPFELKIQRALKDVDKLKTASCLDTNTVGLYCEGRLAEAEREKCEQHMESCLYCVHQLNEMSKLLHYHKQESPVSSELMDKLTNLYTASRSVPSKDKNRSGWNVIDPLKEFFTFPVRQWRYSLAGLMGACAAIFITLAVLEPDLQMAMRPTIDRNAFVNIRAMADDGRIISDSPGVVVGSKGFIATNLSSLAKANAVQVISRDGTTYAIKNVMLDESRNLAVMKIDNQNLPSLPVADMGQVDIGQKVFLLDGRRKANSAVVSDFKSFSGRRKDGDIQFIQLASFAAQPDRGGLVDKDGKLIGLVIAADNNTNLAIPFREVENLIKENKEIPVIELKQSKFSAKALNFYMKGILDSNAHKWSPAIDHLKKAVELDPNLEGAYIELGYAYFREQKYDLEAKAYEEALRINGRNADAIFSLASNLESRGFYEQATKEFEKGLAIDPSSVESFFDLGVLYIAQGQKIKALEIYSRLKTLDPGMAEILQRLAGQSVT